MEPSSRFWSRISSACSGRFTQESSLPQEPVTGLRTAGYPIWAQASRAASTENAIFVLGVATLPASRASEHRALSSQIAVVSAELIVGIPQRSKTLSVYAAGK